MFAYGGVLPNGVFGIDIREKPQTHLHGPELPERVS